MRTFIQIFSSFLLLLEAAHGKASNSRIGVHETRTPFTYKVKLYSGFKQNQSESINYTTSHQCLRCSSSHFLLWYESAESHFLHHSPVSVAHRALPVCGPHTAPAADAVAAAAAHGALVPELPQRPLAPSAGPLPVLPGVALCAFPPQLL